MTTVESDFVQKLQSLNDASVLQALRGVCEQIAKDIKPSKTNIEANESKKARNTCKKAQQARSKSSSAVPTDHPLLVPLRSVIVRSALLSDVQLRSGITKYLAGFIGEHVSVLDVIFGPVGDRLTTETLAAAPLSAPACELVFEAIRMQDDEVQASSFKKLFKVLRRLDQQVVSQSFAGQVSVVVDKAVEALSSLSSLPPSAASMIRIDARVLELAWAPWALAIAALPYVNSRYQMLDTEDPGTRRTTVQRVVEMSLEAMVNRPELLVDSLSKSKLKGGTQTGCADMGMQGPINTAMALVEVTLQTVLGLSICDHGKVVQGRGDKDVLYEADKSVAGLLTVRWELEWVARALGVCADFRSHVAWNAPIRNKLLEFLLEDRDQSSKMANEFGRAVGLRCTPPQTLVALELLRASKASRDANDPVFAGHIGNLLRAGMEGMYRPKEVMSEARNQEFANLGQRIQVLISRNVQLETMFAELGTGNVKLEDREEDGIGVESAGPDEDVDELLSMIGVGDKTTGSCVGTRSTPRSAKRKVEPQRVGDVVIKEEKAALVDVKGQVDGVEDDDDGMQQATASTPESAIHHKGRVVMPPTYNLDSESRELLWKEYLKDKDKLVEMLADTSYRNWHDESRRPELKRNSGFEKAFDAIFGAGKAINDIEGTIIDDRGALIEVPDKKPLDLCWSFPWDALLVGVLAVATDMVRQVDTVDPEISIDVQHARLLAATADAYEVRHYVEETLAALPDTERETMSTCTGDFDKSAGLGALICITGTMRKILMHTSMHTRPELLCQYLELMQVTNARCFKDLSARRKLRRPALLVSSNLRACMSFPPLMGKAINSKSAKLLPELCALTRNTESIVYTAACCWYVWHSLKSKRVPTEWIPSGVDLSTHPLCAAAVQQRCHFISSSLRLISAMIHEIDEGKEDGTIDKNGREKNVKESSDELVDLITALVASSSLCATAAIDLRKGLILYRSRAKSTKSAFQIVCEQKQVHLNLFSVASALCEIYCGLADDWDEFLSLHQLETTRASEETGPNSGLKDSRDSIPHAGAVVFGFDFTEAMQSYLEVLVKDQEAVLCSAISTCVIKSIRAMISETQRRLDRILKRIQDVDKTSQVYIMSAQQIATAPAVVVLDTVTHYAAAETVKAANGGDSAAVGTRVGAETKPTKKRKTIKDVENSYVRAALMEGDADLGDDDFLLDDDLSDLEDFIVTKPDFDYAEFFQDHFPQGQSDDEDD